MKNNFTQKELITLSNGIVSLIELIDTDCSTEMKREDYIKELQELHKKICKMIKE